MYMVYYVWFQKTPFVQFHLRLSWGIRCGKQPFAIVVNLWLKGPNSGTGEEKRLRRQPFVSVWSWGLLHRFGRRFTFSWGQLQQFWKTGKTIHFNSSFHFTLRTRSGSVGCQCVREDPISLHNYGYILYMYMVYYGYTIDIPYLLHLLK